MDNEMHPPLRQIGPAVADHFVACIDHGSSMLPRPPLGCLALWGDTTNGERIPLGKPGTASQFQRRELVAVPALRRAHRSAFSRESRVYKPGETRGCGPPSIARGPV